MAGRRLPTVPQAVLDNPAKMYLINKENAYNKRLKALENNTNPNVFAIIWTEPNNRYRIYSWEIVNDWNWINVTDVLTQKSWYFPKNYRMVQDWKQTWFNNIDTAKQINQWYLNNKWKNKKSLSTLFYNLYNEDGLTLWDLTNNDILNK